CPRSHRRSRPGRSRGSPSRRSARPSGARRSRVA
ncbi:MAG: hypothetical protein AVDCRST_MAG20-1458, partial [uncultured Acidimicrobiales bacterium]